MIQVVEDLAFCERDGISAAFTLSADEGPLATDMAVLREVWDEDVYHLDGLELDGRTVVDLGAHMGAFAVRAGRLGADVLAVEADGHNALRCSGNAAMNGVALRTYHAFVGNYSGSVSVELDKSTGMAHKADGKNGSMVPNINIDELLIEAGDVAVLKVDIEGAEYEVLSRSRELARCERIAVEFHAQPVEVELGKVLTRLLFTHSIQAFGNPEAGGMIYARRYGT